MDTKSNISQNKVEKIVLTKEIRKRIKELQNDYGYDNPKIANILEISIYKYKNIICGNNKKIEFSLIKKMAQKFDCTIDYICCQSMGRHLDKYGNTITNPLDCSDPESKILDIVNFLNNDYNTLKNIHLFLIQVPADVRANILSALDSLSQIIRISALIDRKDSLSKDKFDYIVKNLIADNKELTMMNYKLAEADSHLAKRRKKIALQKYLEIIYYASFQSAPAAKIAITNIISLRDTWNNFPAELDPLIKLLPKMEKNNFIKYPSKVETIISNYLSSQNINIKSRKEYFASLE